MRTSSLTAPIMKLTGHKVRENRVSGKRDVVPWRAARAPPPSAAAVFLLRALSAGEMFPLHSQRRSSNSHFTSPSHPMDVKPARQLPRLRSSSSSSPAAAAASSSVASAAPAAAARALRHHSSSLTSQGEITGLDFSPCGKLLASVGFDGDLFLWQSPTMENVMRLRIGGEPLLEAR